MMTNGPPLLPHIITNTKTNAGSRFTYFFAPQVCSCFPSFCIYFSFFTILLTTVIDFAHQDNIRMKRAREMITALSSVSWSTSKSFYFFCFTFTNKIFGQYWLIMIDYQLSRSQTGWGGFWSLSMDSVAIFFSKNFSIYLTNMLQTITSQKKAHDDPVGKKINPFLFSLLIDFRCFITLRTHAETEAKLRRRVVSSLKIYRYVFCKYFFFGSTKHLLRSWTLTIPMPEFSWQHSLRNSRIEIFAASAEIIQRYEVYIPLPDSEKQLNTVSAC